MFVIGILGPSAVSLGTYELRNIHALRTNGTAVNAMVLTVEQYGTASKHRYRPTLEYSCGTNPATTVRSPESYRAPIFGENPFLPGEMIGIRCDPANPTHFVIDGMEKTLKYWCLVIAGIFCILPAGFIFAAWR
ncbi:MAG TPA: hypothetical protein PK765_05635 [bacterium]|nr:hypothetical protein [bacterium]